MSRVTKRQPTECEEFRRALRGQMSRREWLRIGGVSLLCPGLIDVLAGKAKADGRPTRIKSCLLLFQAGGVSQTDTFDMKPQCAEIIRGEFKPIGTNVPGMHVCEHLPKLAPQMDKLCVVRAMHHRMLCHNPAIYSALAGREVGDSLAVSNMTFASREDYPHYGSIVSKFKEHPPDLPPFVALPFKLRNGPARSPGQHAGFLGSAYDPFLIQKDPSAEDFRVEELAPQPGMTAGRFSRRKGLLEMLDAQLWRMEASGAVDAMSEYYRQAFSLLTTPRAKQAFDLSREEEKLRDRYGRHIVGQSTLLARRLIEAGIPFVTVYSPVSNIDEPSWDTHLNNFPRLKEQLLPPVNQSLPALLEDMGARGLLSETLVIWMSEFGRTPKVGANRSNNSNNKTGRDHWPGCYTILMAGGGVGGGRYYGASDKDGWYPKDDPVHVGDLAATIYHAFGIDPKRMLYDPLSRPHVLAEGEVLHGLLA